MTINSFHKTLTNSTFEVKQLCMALGACQGRSPAENFFRVPIYTNSINNAELNLERMNYWLGPPINQYKVKNKLSTHLLLIHK